MEKTTRQSGRRYGMTARDAMRALIDLGGELRGAASPAEVLKQAADTLHAALEPDLLVVYARQGEALTLCEVRPPQGLCAWHDAPMHRVGECLCGLAAQERVFTASRDILGDPRCVRTECKKAGLKSFAAVPVHDGDGQVTAVIGFASRRQRDFGRLREFMEALSAQVGVGLANATLRARLEELLGRTRARLEEETQLRARAASEAAFRQAVIDAATGGVCVCEAVETYPFVRFSLWSRRMTEITGYTMDEMNRLGWYQTLYSDPALQQQAIRRMEAMRSRTDLHSEEWEIRRRDGAPRILSITTRRLDGSGAPRVLALIEDRTEARQVERDVEQLRAEMVGVTRVRALGEMAAALAHELNQPLAAAATNSATALAVLDADSPDLAMAREALRALVRDVERASTLIGGLRAFLRGEREIGKRDSLDLNALVQEILAVLQVRLAAEHIDVVADMDPALPPVRGDRPQLQQVILNLLSNAIDALCLLDGRRVLRLRSAADLKRRVVAFWVCDNGPGFNEAARAGAFTPFVTSKPDGLGLGLAICKRIVEEHEGELWIENAAGGGACVGFRLPLIADVPMVEETVRGA